MAIFQLNKGVAERVKLSDFHLEKDLQKMVENNLLTIFNCRFIATEFSTGSIHAGRIDTLALSEDNNPVIIEYKKVASSELINQSLYYLHWIRDHKGDFQVAVNKALTDNVEVDWSEIRVICLAPEYKKYDIHAVQVMGANIELWQYKLYENGVLNLEEVYRRTENVSPSEPSEKNPVMVEAGKKAAVTRKTGIYSLEQHTSKIQGELLNLFETVREYIIGLNSSIEETPKQDYISYKTSQNFACVEIRKSKLFVFLKINPDEIKPLPAQCRDVRNIGHFGTGDLEVTLTTLSDFEQTKYLIEVSLKNIGG
jgi:predicted transport protein